LQERLVISQLFERNRAKLDLTLVCGRLDRCISVARDGISPADLVGHLNLIHKERIQVLGRLEVDWMERHLANGKTRHHLLDIISGQPAAFILADHCQIPEYLLSVCKQHDIPLFATSHSASGVVDAMRSYVAQQLAEKVDYHGVFMDVLGLGVLITGDSGVGKSELGLELISRGHGLIADDNVELYRVKPDALEGRCPKLLQNYLEVRGLGLLNIRTVFGETACRRRMRVRLIVHLMRNPQHERDIPRLPLDDNVETILGVEVRRVVLPVAAGRNLAVLLEAAVRTTVLKLRGIDPMMEFLDRQRQEIDKEG